MAENSGIAWTDHTFDAWIEKDGARVVAAEAQWKQVERWNREAEQVSLNADGGFDPQPSPDNALKAGMSGLFAGNNLLTIGTVRNTKTGLMVESESGGLFAVQLYGGYSSIVHRPRVFVGSMMDWAEDWQGPMVNSQGNRLLTDDIGSWFDGIGPAQKMDDESSVGTIRPLTMNDVRARLFRLIDACQNLDFLMLTKRPKRIREYWYECDTGRTTVDDAREQSRRSNVWLLTSIANQDDAERNIPELLNARDLSPVLGVSAEPLIGPVDLVPWMGGSSYYCPSCRDWKRTENEMAYRGGEEYHCVPCGTRCRPRATLDWVIVGGESGPNARPYNVEWARSIIQQCQTADVAVFHKQLGAKPIVEVETPRHIRKVAESVGARASTLRKIKDKAGGDPSEWPEDLRVREFPCLRIQH